MEGTFFDIKDINAYADTVWNESLTGSTRLIDASLRTKPGKYDEEDSFVSVIADKQKKDRYSKLYAELERKINEGNDHSFIEDFAYVPDEEEEKKQDVDDEKILIKRKKKRESHKKFVGRMAAAIVICCVATSYTVGHILANNPDLLDMFRNDKPASTIVEERNIDVVPIAEKRLDAITLLYSNYIKKNPKLIYTNGSRISYSSSGRMIFSYNSEGITKILMDANEKSELEFRVALLTIAEEIGQNNLYNTLLPCIRAVGYDFFIREDDDTDRKPIGPGYHSVKEYLQFEPNNIYTDIISDTESKINNGSIYVYPNGTFYEVGANTVNRERSK